MEVQKAKRKLKLRAMAGSGKAMEKVITVKMDDVMDVWLTSLFLLRYRLSFLNCYFGRIPKIIDA